MSKKARSSVVISEPDIQAALAHLRSLPFAPAALIPRDRHQLLTLIRDALPKELKIGETLEIGPGVYGILKPFGVDLASFPLDSGRLQVWIAVRSAGTDPASVVEL
jgi:hypothetical protein